MKNINIILSLLVLTCFSCYEKPEVSLDVKDSALIPLPTEVETYSQAFVLDQETVLYTSSDEGLYAANEFSSSLASTSNQTIPVRIAMDISKPNAIHFVVDKDFLQLSSKEAYTLSVNEQRILLTSGTQEGLYRGVQTLKQLMPFVGLKIAERKELIWAIPGCEIKDSPVLAYRGAMLDVARHFFSVKDVKRYIDLLSLYKINTLHLHLADDQGWRIEITSWPKLTEIGGSTAVGGGSGGYYSQEDYKDIVAYATQKHITVIPEIDMPGHTNAALASYPELNCNGKATELYTGMRVGFSSLCVDKEVTYTFVDDVIRELAAITPGNYIHLGGDESHATSKKDYSTFLQKVFPIVNKYNKQVMGWEDIQSAGIDSSTIIQHWTDEKKGIAAAAQGAKVVLSPAPYTYLDMKYDDSTKLGLTWAGAISIEKAYEWEPLESLSTTYRDQIIGIESPLWSETVSTIQDIEFMAFPRIIGHSELGWNGKTRKDKTEYYKDLKKDLKRLDRRNVNYKK